MMKLLYPKRFEVVQTAFSILVICNVLPWKGNEDIAGMESGRSMRHGDHAKLQSAIYILTMLIFSNLFYDIFYHSHLPVTNLVIFMLIM